MRKKSIERMLRQPLTPLRFELASKLLNLQTAGNAPENLAKDIAKISKKLGKTGLSEGQLEEIDSLASEVETAIEAGRPFADTLEELMFQFETMATAKKVDQALRDRIHGHLAEWRENIFPYKELERFCERLRKAVPDGEFEEELTNARAAISRGIAPEEIFMQTPARQLVWGAHIIYLLFNPEQMQLWPKGKATRNIVKSQLWKQLLGSHNVKYLRALFGSHIFNLLRRNDILIGWGAPGSWFSFKMTPAPGRVMGDLLYSMIVGFDHARACIIHEISHAVQTRGVAKEVRALSARIQELEQQISMNIASREERVELELATMERQYRRHFVNAAEDNCVNRFTENIGQVFGQDYGYSLNYFYTAAGDVGRRYAGTEDPYPDDNTVNRFRNLCYIISRVFLANNGLFPNTEKGWKSIKAKTHWITGRNRKDPESLLIGDAAFRQLLDMCEEVEYMFPPVRQMAGGPEKYEQKAIEFTEKRFALIEEIYKLFADGLVQQMLEQRKKQLEDQQEEQDKEPPKKPDEPEKPPQDDSDDDDEDQSQSNSGGSDGDQADHSPDSDNNRPGEELPPQPQEDYDPPEGVDDSDVDAIEADIDAPEEEESGEDGEESEEQEQEGGEEQQEGAEDQPDEKAEEEAGGEDGAQDDRSGGSDGGAEEKDNSKEDESGEDTGEEGGTEDGEVEEIEDEEGEEIEKEPEKELPEEQEEFKTAPEEGDEDAEVLPEIVEPDDPDEDTPEYNVETQIEQEEVEDEQEADIVIEDETLEPELKEMPETDKAEDEEAGEDDQGSDQGGEGGGDSSSVRDTDFFPDEELASIGDLRDALQQAMRQEEEPDEPTPPREHQETAPEEHWQPNFSKPEAMNLDELAQGSWDNFAQRVAMHAPIIAMMAGALRRLKDAQLKIIYRISKRHTLTPPGGDLRRFDQTRADKLFKKLASQEKIVKDDLDMFFRDAKRAASTRPSRVILIDGSRSMSMGASPLPMDKAIQEAIIDYKASEVAGYDTYIVMYGPLNPIVIAQPGDNPVQIGKNIEQVRGGLNTATHVAPGILQTIQLIANRSKFNEPYVGFTNFVIYSDGDIDDPMQTMILIEQIVQYAPKTTFDFVLITTRQRTPMDQMLLRLQFGHPMHQVGVIRGSSARKYPMALTATYVLTNRLKSMKSGFADPAFKRSGQFKRLLNHLIHQRK